VISTSCAAPATGTTLALLPTVKRVSSPRTFSDTGRVPRPVLGGIALALLVTAGVAFAGKLSAASEAPKETSAAARRVLTAAGDFRAENPRGCPTLTGLVEDGRLARDARTDDAWGQRFRIVCDGERTSVRSAGPDRKPGTPDDLVEETAGG
jgi:general secretion pathway protein G